MAPQFGLFASIAILSLLNKDNIESNVFEEETIFAYIAVLDVYIASITPLMHKVTNWIINSRCTNYIYHDREDFISYTSLRKAIHITDRTAIYTQGRGSIDIEFILPNNRARVTRINNVLYIPQL